MNSFARTTLQACTRQPHTRRTLFSLPDLSSLSPFANGNSRDPQTYHERKILPYRPSQLYNVVKDVESYPQFLPFCTGSRILSKSPSNLASGIERMEAEMTVGFMSFEESYVSDVTLRPNEAVEVVASSSTPLFTSLSSTWRFQPASKRSPHLTQNPPLSSATPQDSQDNDSGPTLVTLDLIYSFSNPVHATVSAAFFGQVSRMMVSAFEERCLKIYGQGRR